MGQVVAGLIRRGSDILLVHQQAPADPASQWALPGGVVEPGEVLPETLAREIREETGLIVDALGRLLYLVQQQRSGIVWTGFIFEVATWRGQIAPNDPDGYIRDVAFVPVEEAIRRLQGLPWRMMREPIVAYLSGELSVPTLWVYQEQPDGDDEHMITIAI